MLAVDRMEKRAMGKGRLEAFSDGVIAVILTIMVLELKVPHGAEVAALLPLVPVFLSYLLSFIYVGIYWNNHHHMLHAIQHIDGRAMWANMHLLFWLSLIPFVTGWANENQYAAVPVALYGFVLLMSAVSFTLLERVLIAQHDEGSLLARAVGKDVKGMVSIVLYVTAIAASFFSPWVACAIYVIVAGMWFIPDRRIERVMPHGGR